MHLWLVLPGQVFSPWILAACSQHPCWHPYIQWNLAAPWASIIHPNKAEGGYLVNSQYGWKKKGQRNEGRGVTGEQWLYKSSNQRTENHLWNSSVRSSPSAWLIRQCLSMAPKCLYTAASSFTYTSDTSCSPVMKKTLIFLWICNKMFKSCDSLLINLICFVTSSTLRLFMSNVMLNSIFSISIASSVCCRLSGGSSSVGMPSKPALAVSRVPEQHRPSVASKWFPWITDKTQVINRFFRFA